MVSLFVVCACASERKGKCRDERKREKIREIEGVHGKKQCMREKGREEKERVGRPKSKGGPSAHQTRQ